MIKAAVTEEYNARFRLSKERQSRVSLGATFQRPFALSATRRMRNFCISAGLLVMATNSMRLSANHIASIGGMARLEMTARFACRRELPTRRAFPIRMPNASAPGRRLVGTADRSSGLDWSFPKTATNRPKNGDTQVQFRKRA